MYVILLPNSNEYWLIKLIEHLSTEKLINNVIISVLSECQHSWMYPVPITNIIYTKPFACFYIFLKQQNSRKSQRSSMWFKGCGRHPHVTDVNITY